MDEPAIAIKGDSEPAVALALLRLIIEHHDGKPDRDWILSTYADCLAVVGGAEIEYDDEDEDDDKPAQG